MDFTYLGHFLGFKTKISTANPIGSLSAVGLQELARGQYARAIYFSEGN